MGCDIHPVMEIKVGGKWYFIGMPEHGRNYNVFALLSGVRGEGDLFGSGVNMPDDASDELKAEYKSWESDAHSLTVVSLERLSTVMAHNPFPLTDSFVSTWFKIMSRLVKDGVAEDARVICWYDN